MVAISNIRVIATDQIDDFPVCCGELRENGFALVV
jgi:hypothetical protein